MTRTRAAALALTAAVLTPPAAILIFSPVHFTRFAVAKAPAAWLGVALGLSGLLWAGRRLAVVRLSWVALLAWAGLTLLWSPAPGRGQLLFLLWVLGFCWWGLASAVIPDQEPRRERTIALLLAGWLAGGALCASLALIQRLGCLELGLHRVTGTIGNPNHLAGVLLLLLPAAHWLISGPRRTRVLGWLGGGLCLGGVLATNCKGALLALAAMALLLAPRRARRWLAVVMLLAATGASFHDGARRQLQSEVSGRAFIARVSVSVWSTQLLHGVGLGGYAVAAAPVQGRLLQKRAEHAWSNLRDPHNLPLFVACELGLVGLGLYLAVIGPSLWACARRRFESANRQALAAWLGLLVHGLFDSALFAPAPVLLAFGWLGLVQRPASSPVSRRALVAGMAGLALFGLVQTSRQALSDAHLVRGLRHAVDPSELLFYRGVLRAEIGQLTSAARDLEGTYRRLPTPERAAALGNLELRRGRPRRAAAWFHRAIALHPRYTPAYNNLGVTYLRMGKTAEARRYLRRARSLRPGDARVVRSWRALEAHRGE